MALLFALLQATGILGLLAGGDHNGDGSHDAHHDANADAHVEHDGFSVSGLLGVGRVPLTFIVQSFVIALGIAGLSLHTLVYGLHAPPLAALLWSGPASITIAFAITAALSRIAGKIFSIEGHEAPARAQLVGATGVVISSRVDRDFGEVRLRANDRTTVRVIVTTEDERPIPEGREVVVVEYDSSRDRLVVSALEAPSPRGDD
jgi:hypothetical protein